MRDEEVAVALTSSEFADQMRRCDAEDTEQGHAEGDRLMCDLLRSLGYGEGVDVFEQMHKWYA